jgi:hypothetical protein
MARCARHHKSTALPVATSWQLRPGLEAFRDLMGRLEKDPGVKAAIEPVLKSIQKKGLFPAGLAVSLYLTYLAFAVVDGVRPRRAIYEKLCAEGTGLSYKTLKDSPAQIKRMADKIERITAGRFFAVTQLADLPVNMRLYAEALRTGLEETPPAYQQPPNVDLICRVREWMMADEYKHRLIADLLTAVAAVLGKDRVYDETYVSQVLSRYKKTRKT